MPFRYAHDDSFACLPPIEWEPSHELTLSPWAGRRQGVFYDSIKAGGTPTVLSPESALPPRLGLQTERAAVVGVAVDLARPRPARAAGEHAERRGLGGVVPEAVRVEQAERGPRSVAIAGADREAGGDLEQLRAVGVRGGK